jgi:hypothetical protein
LIKASAVNAKYVWKSARLRQQPEIPGIYPPTGTGSLMPGNVMKNAESRENCFYIPASGYVGFVYLFVRWGKLYDNA